MAVSTDFFDDQSYQISVCQMGDMQEGNMVMVRKESV
jgi:hypothetical protein